MRCTGLTALICATATPLLAADATLTASFDHSESLKAWSFHNGPEFPGATGRIALDAKQGHDRPGCLALHYSFVGGGNYVQAAWSLPEQNGARSLTLWLHKPARHKITFRAVDSGGQSFQKGTDYAYDGWQKLEVGLDRWESHFGGANDGEVRFPIRQIGILIENTAEPRQGLLLVDDLALSPAPADHRTTLTSTYVAADFAGGAAWRTGGGQGNRLEQGRWHYAFNEGHSPSLSAGYSLLGEPTKLRLTLESDGSGHAVHALLGSHFQAFHRQIGTLAEKGPQVIEVPLGDLKTWQHSGMENDGVVRYPLRLEQIRLERRPGGPDRGSLQLGQIEVEYRFAAAQAVILRPDLHEAAPGELRFSVELQNLRGTPAKGRLVREYRSLGRRLDRRTVELELPAGARPVRQEYVYPRGEHHFVETSFQWMEADYATKPVAIGTSTLPEDPGSSELQPESIMGAGVYLYRWRGDHRAPDMMRQLASLAQRAGVKWTREEFSWAGTERSPGKYDWSFYDQVVDIAHAHGMSVYALMCYWSEWARPNTQEGIDAYCRWVREAVRRYKARIHHWEIWNEPNIFFWSGPRELYAKLLTQAYETIKAEDPAAQVLGCSTAGIDSDFIRKTIGWGGRFDALTIHPYRGSLDDLAYIEDLRQARELVGGRDVWLTEIGFPSHLVTGWSERRQASLVARVYLASAASGAVRNVSWYDFRNDGPDPFENEQNFGVVRSDFRPKPAYRTLATVCRTLGGLSVKEPVPVGDGAYAFRFRSSTHDVVAACAPDSGRLLAFETDAAVTVTDAVGQVLAPRRDGGRRTVTLDTGFPVYVSGPPGFAFKAVDAPVTLRPESAGIRPGERLRIRAEPSVEIREWELPEGWTAAKAGDGLYELHVPATAPAGGVDLLAITAGESPLRLPLAVRVAASVIRL